MKQSMRRVRGRTSGGTNGVWSSTRSFEIRHGTTTCGPAALSALTLNPTSVVGGNSSQGTLSSAAPAPAVTVTLEGTESTPLLPSGTYDGITRSATVQVAEYASGNRQLRVEATSSNSSDTLKVHVTSMSALTGTLRNEGGGDYPGDFSWSSNPQNITVRSSLGGPASRTVTL
jgi:hypothetical protein